MNKSNSIINKFLLAGDKFMPELHLVDPIVKKYGACGPFANEFKISRFQDFLNTGKLVIFTKMILIKLVFNMIWHII